MPGRNEDRQDYRYDQSNTTQGSFQRRVPRRRPAMDEPDTGSARQERRRRAALELEQVEKAYLEKRQAAKNPPAYPAYDETMVPGAPPERYSSVPMHEEIVPGHPNGPLYPDQGYSPPSAAVPLAENPEPVVPAYPAPKKKQSASGRFQSKSRNRKSGSNDGEPLPAYPAPTQGNEVVIDTAQTLSPPRAPQVVLPIDKEYGGRSEILHDDDDPMDEATTLAKGGRLQAKISTKRRKKRVGKRRYGVFMGSVVLLFAFVGITVAVLGAVNLIRGIVSDDSALRAYDELIAPVVGLNPEPFENIKGADPEMVLLSSILAVEYASADTNEYSDFENNVQNIPVSEILVQATNLFGPDCNVRLQSIEDELNSYVYDEGKDIIVAPLFSNIGAYMGRTVSSRRNGDSVLLRVAYISSANWAENTPDGADQDVDERDLVVDKYMEYELKTDPETGLQYIFAIRSLDEDSATPQSGEDLL